MLLQGWIKIHDFKKVKVMPTNAIILIAQKWRQTSEEIFLNRKYVSEQRDANIHPNVCVNMREDNISYDNVLYLIPG